MPSVTPTRKASRSLILTCAVFYLLVITILFVQMRSHTGHHFVYALDDPYIHLALAEQLAHGHYGINAIEPSSPSSSILWPLLLVPFTSQTWHVFLPLVWNILFGLTASCLIALAVSLWPSPTAETPRTTWLKKLCIAILLIAAANLFSLTMIGMEHVLQIALAIACAIGIMEALDGNEIPTWCLVAATIAPMVRYEDLALTLAVALVLAVQHHYKKAAAIFVLSLLPLVVFGYFLKSLDLPFLPTSVLVKGGVYAGHSHTLQAIQDIVTDPNRLPAAILSLLLIGVVFLERNRTRQLILAAAALVPVLQLLVGRFGWFRRYEVYAIIFGMLILTRLLAARPGFKFAYLALILLFFTIPYLDSTFRTAAIATEVYDQQYQMARFAHDFYKGDVAVNDLGLVSYRHPPGTYVLDVFGLASPESARQIDKSAPWLEGIVQRHNIGLAMLFPKWFHIPPDWAPMAKMCLPAEPIVVGGRCVVFYSTSFAQREQIRTELQQFGPTLPPKVTFTLNQPTIR